MMRHFWRWPMLILASTAIVVIAAAGLLPLSVQGVAIFWFLLVCPGLAYVPLFRFGSPILEFVIALGVSFALNTMVTLGLVLINAWSMQVSLLIMVGITLLGVCMQLAQRLPALRRRLG